MPPKKQSAKNNGSRVVRKPKKVTAKEEEEEDLMLAVATTEANQARFKMNIAAVTKKHVPRSEGMIPEGWDTREEYDEARKQHPGMLSWEGMKIREEQGDYAKAVAIHRLACSQLFAPATCYHQLGNSLLLLHGPQNPTEEGIAAHFTGFIKAPFVLLMGAFHAADGHAKRGNHEEIEKILDTAFEKYETHYNHAAGQLPDERRYRCVRAILHKLMEHRVENGKNLELDAKYTLLMQMVSRELNGTHQLTDINPDAVHTLGQYHWGRAIGISTLGAEEQKQEAMKAYRLITAAQVRVSEKNVAASAKEYGASFRAMEYPRADPPPPSKPEIGTWAESMHLKNLDSRYMDHLRAMAGHMELTQHAVVSFLNGTPSMSEMVRETVHGTRDLLPPLIDSLLQSHQREEHSSVVDIFLQAEKLVKCGATCPVDPEDDIVTRHVRCAYIVAIAFTVDSQWKRLLREGTGDPKEIVDRCRDFTERTEKFKAKTDHPACSQSSIPGHVVCMLDRLEKQVVAVRTSAAWHAAMDSLALDDMKSAIEYFGQARLLIENNGATAAELSAFKENVVQAAADNNAEAPGLLDVVLDIPSVIPTFEAHTGTNLLTSLEKEESGFRLTVIDSEHRATQLATWKLSVSHNAFVASALKKQKIISDVTETSSFGNSPPATAEMERLPYETAPTPLMSENQTSVIAGACGSPKALKVVKSVIHDFLARLPAQFPKAVCNGAEVHWVHGGRPLVLHLHEVACQLQKLSTESSMGTEAQVPVKRLHHDTHLSLGDLLELVFAACDRGYNPQLGLKRAPVKAFSVPITGVPATLVCRDHSRAPDSSHRILEVRPEKGMSLRIWGFNSDLRAVHIRFVSPDGFHLGRRGAVYPFRKVAPEFPL